MLKTLGLVPAPRWNRSNAVLKKKKICLFCLPVDAECFLFPSHRPVAPAVY